MLLKVPVFPEIGTLAPLALSIGGSAGNIPLKIGPD
jgi:hypothetical protein